MSAGAAASEALRGERLGGARARIVRHVAWTGAGTTTPQGLRFALEDALRTTDFHDAGRLIVVRRLQLRLQGAAAATPAALAAALAAAWHRAARGAVPATAPQAAQAEAVWFGSATAARLQALQQLAGGRALTAWFWPRALPPPRGTAAARPDVTGLVESLLDEDAAPALLAALRELDDAALLSVALHLDVPAAHRLAAALQVPLPPSVSVAAAARAARPAPVAGTLPSPALQALSARLAAHPSLCADAPALRWVAALWSGAAAADTPSWARAAIGTAVPSDAPDFERLLAALATVPPALAPRSDRTDTTVAGPPLSRGAPTEVGAAGTRVAAAAPAPAPHLPLAARGTVPPRAPTVALGSDLPDAADDRGLAAAPGAQARRRPRSPLPWLADARPSAHGGLLFLLNLLRALHVDDWLAGQPAAARPASVAAWFRLAMCCAGVPADDPQQAWFGASADAPRGWPAAVAEAGSDTRHWLARVRRTLRRRGGLSLRECCTHPAWITATPTHVDVVLRLDDVDLRLRRLGLDADPGWVPWFGRIVAFHFVEPALWPVVDGHG